MQNQQQAAVIQLLRASSWRECAASTSCHCTHKLTFRHSPVVFNVAVKTVHRLRTYLHPMLFFTS